MKRLTDKDLKELRCRNCCHQGHCHSETDCISVLEERLAMIEDILDDEYDLDRLKELVEADKLIGKTVYKIERWCDGTKGDCGSFVDCKDCDDYELKVYECSILGLDDAMQAIKNMGKTIFATYNEAEAKLYKTEK